MLHGILYYTIPNPQLQWRTLLYIISPVSMQDVQVKKSFLQKQAKEAFDE